MSTFERMLKVLADRVGNETSLITKMLRSSDRTRQSRSRRSRGLLRPAMDGRAEQLEARLAMTIELFSPAINQGFATWTVITSDHADDVYVQQVATVPQDLWVADNASFNDYKSFNGFHRGSLSDGQLFNGINTETTIYVTNGTGVLADVQPNEVSDGSLSTFVLGAPVEIVTTVKDTVTTKEYGSVEGVVSHAGNTWTFTNKGSGDRLFFDLKSSGGLSDPKLIQPLSGQVVVLTGRGDVTNGIRIAWSAPALAITGQGGPLIDSVTYNASNTELLFTEASLAKSSGDKPKLQLPVTPVNPGGIVPGTLSGVLTVDGYDVRFRINNLINGSKLLFEKKDAEPSLIGEVIINQGTPLSLIHI